MSAIIKPNWLTVLVNPFVYVAGGKALSYGAAGIVIAGFIAGGSGAHFDGVLDLHFGRGGSVLLPIAEGFVDWLCVALVLVVCGKVVSASAFRLLDVLGTQALARWPTMLTALLVLPAPFRRFTRDLLKMVLSDPTHLRFDTMDALYFFAASFLLLPLVVWQIALMYNAYALSCNVRGLRAGLSFTAGLIVAEILSKLAIGALPR
jgi:hypothetical protein